jgi:membrane-bound serine protease (ClpP class)
MGLILLGIVFFVAEAFVPSYGALGLGGVAAFGFGALLLIDSEVPGFGVSPWLVGGLALASAAFVVVLGQMALRSRRRPVRTGLQRFVGATAEVIEFGGGEGWALVDGERWRISAAQALRPGQQVRIARAEGFTLEVNPLAVASSTGANSR